MFRTRISGLVVLLFCLLVCGVLSAAEVALVTEKTGKVQASFAGDEWEIELAEMLPDGVEIKVSPDGSLILVHLPTSKEYRFTADATAKITMASVTGEKFTAGEVELVSSNINLGNQMGDQTGAVNPDTVNMPGAANYAEPVPAPAPAQSSVPAPALARKPKLNQSARPEADKLVPDMISVQSETENTKSIDLGSDSENRESYQGEETKKKEDTLAPATKPEQTVSPQEDSYDSGADSSGVSPIGGSNGSSDEGQATTPGFILALPAEVFAKICSDETSFKVTGENVTGSRINFAVEGWIEAEVDSSAATSGTLLLNGNLASISVEICAPVTGSTIIEAWKLEKTGHLYQAAAMWIALQKKGLPAAKVAPHLKRLKAAILEMNK